MATLQPARIDLSEDADPNDLVVRAQGGCEASFAELARRYYPRLVQLVLPRIPGSSHMDAEDIAQESLARAFLKLDAFDPRYRFSTWLYTIAIRIATDHNRGVRRRLALLETHRTLFELRSSTSASSAAECEQREVTDRIWQVARASLGEPLYTAMWLRFAEDLSVAEIASVMRKTKVGVRVLLHRARTKMLKVMNTEDENSRRDLGQPLRIQRDAD
jgi:RNA polymerase sigma-70 factor (ECF subfamily)